MLLRHALAFGLYFLATLAFVVGSLLYVLFDDEGIYVISLDLFLLAQTVA